MPFDLSAPIVLRLRAEARQGEPVAFEGTSAGGREPCEVRDGQGRQRRDPPRPHAGCDWLGRVLSLGRAHARRGHRGLVRGDAPCPFASKGHDVVRNIALGEVPRLTTAVKARLLLAMGNFIRSIVDARLTARQPNENLIWVSARAATLFNEPGWVKLEPPRDGAVLFIHPQRRIRAVRKPSPIT
jgi:hypothetical protein